MKAPPADRSRLAEAVYQSVKSDIFEFRMLPGTRFSENEVARRARVSRTPVREALLRLQREGFLDVQHKSGWRVRPLDFDRFEHLYDARIVLVLNAVRTLCTGELRAAPQESLAALKKTWLVPPKQRLADWIEANLTEAFTVLRVPAGNRRRLRTTNGLARLNKEIKRRTRVATIFPNEASLLRLASAVLSEIRDAWETERAYLTMEAR